MRYITHKACTIMIKFNTKTRPVFSYIYQQHIFHVIGSQNIIIHQKILNACNYSLGSRPSHLIRTRIVWLQKMLGQPKKFRISEDNA